MPVGINFSKAKAERYLDALTGGKPISPSGPGWTADDMLALAGACHFAAMSHGPVRLSDREASKIPLERREAAEETFMADLQAAIGFYSQLTMEVRDGDYDRACEPEAKAVVFTSDEGLHFTPISGFRDHSNAEG